MSFLRLDQISKSFQGKGSRVKALDAVNLELAEGELTTVLGPSGCGKTTLLHIVAGIEFADEGRILLADRDISRLRPEDRCFGLVFQNYALFPNLTVFENIGYGLRRSRWDRAGRRDRVSELMDMTGLSGLEKRYPAQLSGGQQQRVALARALAPKPQLLLLDEPLSALDAQVRLTLGQELRRIQRQTGVTAIMVTHDQREALALADRIILMDCGRIRQMGPPEEIYTRPNCRFGAEFIGHMNVLALPGTANGRLLGLRYEDVVVLEPTEQALASPHTWVGRVEHRALMGAYYRLELLLNDFKTRLYADVPRSLDPGLTGEGALVAVRLPEEHWYGLADESPGDVPN